MNKECSVNSCENSPIARGYCGTHYNRWKRGMDLDAPIQKKNLNPICTVEGCNDKTIARALCAIHYSRQERGMELTAPMRRRKVVGTAAERMKARTPQGLSDDVCWEWTGTRNKGYGIIKVDDGRQRNAHTVAWEMANNATLPKGMVVRHKCDNPPCVNPAHLESGTHADNVSDKVNRGRTLTGKKNPMTKLHPAEVMGIHLMLQARWSQSCIGEVFNTSQTNVSMIKRGKTWGHM